MAATFLRLLVLLLGFSHLVCLNAVPVTRTRSLVNVNHGRVISEDTRLLANMEKRWEVKSISGRMIAEVNDYAGSGANNRHTPKRGCVDC